MKSEDVDLKPWGKYFEELRFGAKYKSATALAKAVGISDSTIRMYERGERLPRLGNWNKLLIALKCYSLDVLFKPLIKEAQHQHDPSMEELCARIRHYCEMKHENKTAFISLLEVMKLPIEIEPPKKREEGNAERTG